MWQIVCDNLICLLARNVLTICKLYKVVLMLVQDLDNGFPYCKFSLEAITDLEIRLSPMMATDLSGNRVLTESKYRLMEVMTGIRRKKRKSLCTTGWLAVVEKVKWRIQDDFERVVAGSYDSVCRQRQQVVCKGYCFNAW